MKNVSFLFALFLCMALPKTLSANDPGSALGSINGTVVDELSKQPVAYAAVVIKSEDGSQTITGSITTENGTFEIFYKTLRHSAPTVGLGYNKVMC